MGAKASRKIGPKTSKVPFRRVELNETDYKFLISTTNLKREEIKELFDKYSENNPDGKMDRDEFNRVYLSLRPEAREQLEKISSFVFKAFDSDNNNFLTYNEFLIGYALTTKGDLKTKIEYTYNLYDANNDGWLSVQEVTQAISGMLELLGENSTEEKANELAQACVQSLDHSQDDKITKEEFINGLLKNYSIRAVMMPFN